MTRNVLFLKFKYLFSQLQSKLSYIIFVYLPILYKFIVLIFLNVFHKNQIRLKRFYNQCYIKCKLSLMIFLYGFKK